MVVAAARQAEVDSGIEIEAEPERVGASVATAMGGMKSFEDCRDTLIDRGPIRMTDLAAHERVRTPTTTVAIRRLEKLGLVKRSRDPSDLRAVLVDITPKGLSQRAIPRSSDAGRAHPSPARVRRAWA